MDAESTITLHTGREMPIIGLGTWQLTDDTARCIKHALDTGYRQIDTSRDYGTQPGIAEGLKMSGVAREDLYVVTKVEENENAFEATRRNVEELGLEYVDLILIHRPSASGAGEELWKGLLRAREEGLAVDIGVSNYSVEQLQALIDSSGEVPVVNQIEWSPFGYSEDMLSFTHDKDIVIQAYSPLTRGERIGDEDLDEVAARHGKTPAQVLIRWNLQLGTVPLPKANRVEHMEENFNVFDFELSDEDMIALSSMNEHYSALGQLQYI